MRALVTGCAGFVGSALARALVDEGHTVRGVDVFTPFYDRSVKEHNLAELLDAPAFEMVEADLRVRDAGGLVSGVDVVFHLAAQPGRLPWMEGFPLFIEHNILATQRLLDAAHHAGVGRFVYASSSSVYGNGVSYPTAETDVPLPHGPYGVTKLAGEHLCNVYAENWGLSTIALRYFTVYGPGQRPDMAIHRLFEAGIADEAFPLYGTGRQVRDITYVDDVVRATILAAGADTPPATVLNVAGGGSISMHELVETASEVLGRTVRVTHLMGVAGDVERTGASIDAAADTLGWRPETGIREGLEAQASWHLRRHGR